MKYVKRIYLFLIVCFSLTCFQLCAQNNNMTPEVAQGGKIVSINGEGGTVTPDDVVKVANIAAFNAGLEQSKTIKK